MSKIKALVVKASDLERRYLSAKATAFNALIGQMKWQTTQKEVAGRMGISQSYLSDMMAGKRGFTCETLRKFERALFGPGKEGAKS